MRLEVNLQGYEKLDVELNEEGNISHYHLMASSETTALFLEALQKFGPQLKKWSLEDLESLGGRAAPKSFSSSERTFREMGRARALRLLRELCLKARGIWKLPYEGQIVCSCRNVSSERIDQAVTAAVPSVLGVAAWTTACTSCTTCRPRIEEIIEHRKSGLVKAEKEE